MPLFEIYRVAQVVTLVGETSVGETSGEALVFVGTFDGSYPTRRDVVAALPADAPEGDYIAFAASDDDYAKTVRVSVARESIFRIVAREAGEVEA